MKMNKISGLLALGALSVSFAFAADTMPNTQSNDAKMALDQAAEKACADKPEAKKEKCMKKYKKKHKNDMKNDMKDDMKGDMNNNAAAPAAGQ